MGAITGVAAEARALIPRADQLRAQCETLVTEIVKFRELHAGATRARSPRHAVGDARDDCRGGFGGMADPPAAKSLRAIPSSGAIGTERTLPDFGTAATTAWTTSSPPATRATTANEPRWPDLST
jgi:hypothetical protein